MKKHKIKRASKMICLIRKISVILFHAHITVLNMKRKYLLTSEIWIKSKEKKINGDVVTRIG